MAEGLLCDLGKKVLEVVGSLALQEIKLASGVKDELENLKSTVSAIQAVLLDAEKQGSHNNKVKDWLNKLRDVFLDADDVLDDFSTEALQHKVMAGNKMTKETLLLRNCRSLRELPEGIEKLVNLRFLDITGCSNELTKMPLAIEHLTGLETILPGVVVRKEGSGASCSGSYKKKKAKSNGGPSQLKELHNLGGKLIIKNLGYGKDDVWEEYKDANLEDKKHLQHLALEWGYSEWDAKSVWYAEICEMLLVALQPHPNLKALELELYMGWRIPSWVSSLTNLVHFRLSSNKRLQHLPPLNQLPFLKAVSLSYMDALEYISDEDSVSNVLGASSSSSSSITPFFPSLSSLRLYECPKLKGWWRNEPHHLLLPSFPPSLSELEIYRCPNLTYMPPFPYLKEGLKLGGCSWKVLEQTMKMEMGAATTSTYFPLSQLQELCLNRMNDFGISSRGVAAEPCFSPEPPYRMR